MGPYSVRELEENRLVGCCYYGRGLLYKGYPTLTQVDVDHHVIPGRDVVRGGIVWLAYECMGHGGVRGEQT